MNEHIVPHTPGPWRPNVAGGADLIDARKRLVARAYDPEDDDAVTREAAANARLIAAAPDLLAALEDLLPYAAREIKRLNDTMVGSLYPAINLAKLDRAEAAIAKARGST